MSSNTKNIKQDQKTGQRLLNNSFPIRTRIILMEEKHLLKTILVLALLLVFTITAAVIIGTTQNSITGATTAIHCECQTDADCDDNNPETTDVCLYADSCIDAICLNKR